MLINGSCHCHNISFSLLWEPDLDDIPVRACGCSFCVKHGGVWTSVPSGALDITIVDSAFVANYTFGTATATFHTCMKCGVVPVATSEIEKALFAVVNANTFNNIDRARLRSTSTDFDGEVLAARLGRRQRNWIGKVRFIEDLV
jgi:hypothetical protein